MYKSLVSLTDENTIIKVFNDDSVYSIYVDELNIKNEFEENLNTK